MKARSPACCIAAAFVATVPLLTPSPCSAQRLAEWDEEAPPTHPEDPFTDHYRLPEERELGATAGQFRMIGSVMLVAEPGGVSPGLHGSLELMTYAYLSVRGSLQTTLADVDGHTAPVFVAKAGPSLHLLPYRRLDLTLFFEGGVAVVSATKADSAPMAVASPGASIELWVTHWMFFRIEEHADCGWYARDHLPHKYVRFGSLFGLGIAL